MINHESKCIVLGSGDVSVGSNWCGLTFQNIRPPQEIGTHLRDKDDVEFVGEIIVLEFSDIPDLSTFSRQLRRVEAGEIDTIVYKDWMIKFSPVDWRSVEVVRVHYDLLQTRMCQCLAC